MWKPLLEGELAEEARSAVLEISRALATGDSDAQKPTDRPLFWAYVAGAFDDDWVAERYDAAMTALGEYMSAGFTHVSLYYGAAGAGFAIAHVSESGTAEDVLGAIDRLLEGKLAETEEYDLIGGLVGIGVYFLERGDMRMVGRTLETLVERAESTPDGLAWFEREAYDCGVAHGAAGALALLARAAEVDPQYRGWALDSLRWVEAQRLPESAASRYPAKVARGVTPRPSRTAWCYGDAGVAIATLGARARLQLPLEPAVATVRAAAARDVEACGVVDAGFCHGAVGLAHIYNRCWQLTGDEELRDAARAWVRRTLDMRRADGLGGYLSFTDIGDGSGPAWRQATSIIEGVMGIGLALLAATTAESEPLWDRVFQCDLP